MMLNTKAHTLKCLLFYLALSLGSWLRSLFPYLFSLWGNTPLLNKLKRCISLSFSQYISLIGLYLRIIDWSLFECNNLLPLCIEHLLNKLFPLFINIDFQFCGGKWLKIQYIAHFISEFALFILYQLCRLSHNNILPFL